MDDDRVPEDRGALRAYDSKRDFALSPEPRGGAGAEAGHRFVVQRHAARRLHYDFRLELDGVLKSWAVTRGPSLVAGDRRLAVETEDHPVDYLRFEGVIPAGQYGGGSVVVWDIGTWTPEGDPRAGLLTGKIAFTLEGQRLKGRWHLVRTRPRAGKEQWLMLKAEDADARAPDAPDILGEATSVISGRTNAELEAEATLPPERRRSPPAAKHGPAAARTARSIPVPSDAGSEPLPAFVEPCLATLAAGAPEVGDWLHEIKFDGYRLQARIEGADVRLLTRSGLDWTDRFGPLATALRHLDLPSALLDGEVVVEDGAGVSSFSALQADLKANRGDRLALYLFDLLHLDGRDTRTLPLRQRKATLKALLDGAGSGGMVRFSDHVGEDGPALKRHACRLGLEGIVSKRADAPYRSGRGGDWVKVKCTARQELVVAGYAPSTVAKRAVGSLVLGVYGEDGTLHHVGRAGTGYTAAEAHDLWAALEPLRRRDPPFAGPLPAEALRGHPVWVEPRLVAEVELRGWTADGAIRHAAFKGLRDDKRAEDVRREGIPEAAPKPARRRAATAAVPPRLTHPDRVLWADVGLTKEGLAGYYSAVAERILPEIAGRPLSLLRGPDGTEGKTFFQKHAWAGLDAAAVRTVSVGDEEALVIDGLPGLVALVQASVLEIHPWGSRMTDPERPDRIVFDLDPGEGVAWVDTVAAAMTVRDRLASLGHRGFVKTTGGKGLHVVLPVVPRVGFDEAKAWARGIAAALESEAPARFTASLAKRARTGRIFIDYLRNGHGATAVAAFSTRARAGAPVAVPVTWEELPSLPPGGGFRVDNILRRLDADTADPWADMDAAARPIAPSAEPRASRRARE